MIATYVRIGAQTFQLGKTQQRDSKIECIGLDGRVHRVCYWRPHGVRAGEILTTNGETLHYFHGEGAL